MNGTAAPAAPEPAASKMVCLAWNPRCETEVCNFTSAESPDCMLKASADQAISYKTMMTGPDTARQTMLCVRLGENVVHGAGAGLGDMCTAANMADGLAYNANVPVCGDGMIPILLADQTIKCVRAAVAPPKEGEEKAAPDAPAAPTPAPAAPAAPAPTPAPAAQAAQAAPAPAPAAPAPAPAAPAPAPAAPAAPAPAPAPTAAPAPAPTAAPAPAPTAAPAPAPTVAPAPAPTAAPAPAPTAAPAPAREVTIAQVLGRKPQMIIDMPTESSMQYPPFGANNVPVDEHLRLTRFALATVANGALV